MKMINLLFLHTILNWNFLLKFLLKKKITKTEYKYYYFKINSRTKDIK